MAIKRSSCSKINQKSLLLNKVFVCLNEKKVVVYDTVLLIVQVTTPKYLK